MKEKKSFYESLSKNSDTNLRNIDIETLIQGRNISKLDTDTAETLDKEISETEVLNVLKAMKNNKSPGSDGFTAEFYKFFWEGFKNLYFQGYKPNIYTATTSCIAEIKGFFMSAKRG